MKPNDLRGGAFGLLVVTGVLAFLIIQWEPTASTDAWLFSLVSMGSFFVPVLGAISLTLVVVSLAFVEVPTQSEEQSEPSSQTDA
jgi:uncharacterized membrane protein